VTGTANNAAPIMIEITFLTNSGKVVTAPENSNLLRVSLREKGGIPFKCGGGLCGTCKCLIERGLENTDAIKPKERKHLTEEQFAAGYRMACQTFINGDVSVSWTVKTTEADPARTYSTGS
jgi:ferredoxin